MRVKRVIVVPPDGPGSKGDEGMLRGALELFRSFPIMILNPRPDESWIGYLQPNRPVLERLSEAGGALPSFAPRLEDGDLLFVIGADVIDGTCGIEPAIEQLDLMAAALARRVPVYVHSSFRSSVETRILDDLAFLQGARFLLRDELSLENFQRQTNIQSRFFPDLSFFYKPQSHSQIAADLARRVVAMRNSYSPILGVNFAEHSFRSFYDEHTDANRREFVATVLTGLAAAHRSAAFVLLSNDVRRWPNHIADDDFASIAEDWIINHLGEGRMVKIDPAARYADNIAALTHVDLLLTGRMHLSLAALRAGTPATILMGVGKGYSSFDKMRGASRTYFGTEQGVITKISNVGRLTAELFEQRTFIKQRLGTLNEKLNATCSAATAKMGSDIDRLSTAEQEPGQVGVRLAAARERLQASEVALKVARSRMADLQAELNTAYARLGEMERKQSEDARRIAALETELDAASSRAAEMERKLTEGVLLPAAALQRLVSAGDRLAEELRRAYARPWRPVKRALQRSFLRLALLAGPALSARQRRRMQRSLGKRLPTAFGDSWNAVLLETLARETGQIAQHQSRLKSMAPGARPSADWRRILTYRTLSLLADLSEPFSARRARKFRRSAEKRAPHNFRNTREVAGVVAAAHPGRPASDPQRARRILVSDCRLPRPDVSAGERATVGLLTDLAALGYEVVFVPIDMCEDITYRTLLEKLGVTVVTKANGYNSAAAFVQTEGHKFGAFYLIRVDVAEALLPSARAAAPDARILFHAPDLYFLRETRAAELNADAEEMAAAEETRRRETAIMRASDHVVLVSPAEWNYVEKILPRDRVTIFPALYSPVAADPPGFLARQHVFFLGGFGHRPNVSAVKWFVDHVWPTVHAALPDAEFHIIGAEAPREIVELGTRPGVRYIGYVADLNPLLDRYRLSVVPLLYGAGIKGKLGMALGAGVPTVTTAIGAEGMGVIDGVHALIRDEPNAFAEAVIALYRDEANWARLARNGRRLVADNFSEFANRAALLRVLESAGVLPLDVYVKYCQTAEPLPLPDPDTSAPIDVSIIIPVHNQWRLTRACLNSVALACLATGLQCEVILADDCSTDETASAASLFPGLRIVRQEVNQGFLRNCNAAAARASGRMLLFLNNDTVVMPNWLTALVTTMEENPDAAIVGSKLLYRDGTIQEAGGVLYSDGSASPVCRGEPNHAPLASYDREVDYCSGASILVRRSFWTEVQGFDERFAPAYCEDSDLAMEARARGMRVLYSARSVVMHLEHGSYDQQPTSPTALMKSNNQKLFDKWRSQFTAEHLLPGTDTLIAAAHAQRKAPPAASTRREGGRLNILYFSPFPSHPDNHGNQATIQSFARKFQRLGHRVHFALLESSLYDANSLAAMREAWDSFDLLPNSRPLSANGSDIPFDGWYQPGLGENIRLLCQKYDIDVVFCSYVFQSKLLEYVPAHILKVIDTHDKMGNRYDMLRANGQPLEFFSCTPEEEGAYLRRADLVAARRAEEADYFNEVTGRNSAFVLPHIEDPRFIDRTFDALRKVGVVASANRINLSIVHDFLTEIMRRCGDNCPFTVEIAGQVKDMITHLPREQQAVFTRPWVRMLGFVPDISSFYRNVDLIVSPVTMGTGINVKTVQAMAFGMPLLTTRIGIKGIETDEPLHQHETIAELVDSLFRLTQQPTELTRLAKISVARYKELLRDAEAAIEDMFNHPKLSAPTATKIPPEVSSKCDKQLFMHRYTPLSTITLAMRSRPKLWRQ